VPFHKCDGGSRKRFVLVARLVPLKLVVYLRQKSGGNLRNVGLAISERG
jgi:hypothetical protein